MTVLLAFSLLPLALLPALPIALTLRIERRLWNGGSTLRAGGFLAMYLVLALVVGTFSVSGMGALSVANARPELRSLSQSALLLASLLGLFGVYRALYLVMLAGQLRHGGTPATVRGATLRYMFLLAAGVLALVLLSKALDHFALFHENPSLRWLAALLLMGTLFSLATPALLLLCWRSQPLEEGPLSDRIRELARRAGVRVPPVRVFDFGSLKVANAWVAGVIAPGRTIFLTRELLKLLSEDEVVAVVGHELGHVRLRHLPLYLLLTLASLAGAWSLSALVPTASETVRQLVQVALFLTIGSAAVYAAMRRCEAAADRFGAKVTGNPAALAQALRKLHSAAGEPGTRSALARVLHTHPDLDERVRRLV